MSDEMNIEKNMSHAAGSAPLNNEASTLALLSVYKAKVIGNMTNSRNSGSPSLFMNDGTANAKIVMDVLIGSAQSTIDIYSEMLFSGVFSAELLKEKIDSNVKVRIVVQDKNVLTNAESALTSLKEILPKVDLRHLDGEAAPGHLCVVDGEYVRYELDHKERKALVAFCDRAVSTSMKTYFDDVLNQSSSITI
jgi:hypothetical protein